MAFSLLPVTYSELALNRYLAQQQEKEIQSINKSRKKCRKVRYIMDSSSSSDSDDSIHKKQRNGCRNNPNLLPSPCQKRYNYPEGELVTTSSDEDDDEVGARSILKPPRKYPVKRARQQFENSNHFDGNEKQEENLTKECDEQNSIDECPPSKLSRHERLEAVNQIKKHCERPKTKPQRKQEIYKRETLLFNNGK